MRVHFSSTRYLDSDVVDGLITDAVERVDVFDSDDHEEVARWLHADRLERSDGTNTFACPDGPELLDFRTGMHIEVVAFITHDQPDDVDKVVAHLATL